MEVLVALVLLTLFTLAAYRALDAVLQTQQQAGAEMDRWNVMTAAFARLESDLANAVIRLDQRNASDIAFHTQTASDGAMQFDLVRLLPEDVDAGLQKVGYRCAQGKLFQLVWPEVDDNTDGAQELVLLQALRACAFRYMDNTGEWSPTWLPKAVQPLPQAVELNLTTGDGVPLRRVWRVQ
jgi:type II secretion system protein J